MELRVPIYSCRNRLPKYPIVQREIKFALSNLQMANISTIHLSMGKPSLFLLIKIALNISIIHYGTCDMFIPYVMELLQYGKIIYVLLSMELQIQK